MRHAIVVILCVVASTGLLWGSSLNEAGLPLVETFGVRDYEEHNQNWTAVQDAAGVLYVGNKDVVLAYDGQAWRSIPTGGLFIRGLGVDASDRVWLGGVNEFGYLEADGYGGRRYVSLREHLPLGDAEPVEIFQLLSTSHGIYLVCHDQVLRWHDGAMTTLLQASTLGWTEGDEFLAHAAGLPLRAFDGRRWRVLLEDGDVLQQTISFTLLRPDGSRLLFTLRDGVHHLNEGRVTPWPTDTDGLFREALISRGMTLRDGTIALVLRQRGVAMLSPHGELRHFLDASNDSLPVARSLGVYEDRDGSLWVLQNSGLVRVAWSHGITYFDRRRGIGTDTVKALARHDGKLYAGTGSRLLVLQPQSAQTLPPAPALFIPVPGAEQSVWALAVAGDELLVGGRDGLRVVAPGASAATLALQTDFISALYSSRASPDHVWSGTFGTVNLLRRTANGWTVARNFPEIAGQVRSFAEDADGAIWVAVSARGYFRIVAPGADTTTWSVEHYPGGHGLPVAEISGLPHLTARGDRALFLVEGRVFQFDAPARRFEPVAPGIPHLDDATRLVSLDGGHGGTLWERTVHDGADAGPWKGRVFSQVEADGIRHALPFAVAERVGENAVFFKESTATGAMLWIGGSDGLVRAPLPGALLPPRPFATVIRRVDRRSGLALPVATDRPVELPFDQRGLTFHFATDRVDDRGMRYQTRLRPTDEEWAPLSSGAALTLDRVPPGKHVFEVRARDTDGRLGTPASFPFMVRPPWWQTWWALALQALVLLGLFFLFARWRLRAVQRRNVELTTLVENRTAELRENQNELVRARDTADAANQSKSDFLAAMSHELRTPLNAILGFTQILLREPRLSSKGVAQLETVNRNGRHLLGLINEVLDLAKIEANRLTLHLAPCSLHRFATELASTFEPRATEKKLTFRLELGLGTPHVLVDEPKLRQVLINLLGNAIKFTAAGEIVLAIASDAAGVHFEVRDTGIGINPKHHDAIFEPFFQPDHAHPHDASEARGTGLGLPISQRLIKLMGGRISVQSRPDGGSSFRFHLALPAATEPRPAAPVRIVGYEGPPRRILVVDDIETNRAILSDLLTLIGFDIVQSATGADALAAQARHAADLVLLDLRLPDMTGEEVARRLRPDGRTHPRLVAVSASVFDLDRDHAERVGCDAFVPKPVDEGELLDCIGRQLDLRWQTKPLPHARPTEDSNSPFAHTTAEILQLPLPPATDLAAWLELARRSDQRRLREAINAAAATGEDAPFRRSLDQLLQKFRTGQVRDILAQALSASAASSVDPPL